MANPYHHAVSSVKKYGGEVEDYIEVHRFFDASKAHHGDYRHHTEGIFEAERVFGVTITNANGRAIPTRWIGEQHVIEDLGTLPSLSDWLSAIKGERWMMRSRHLSRELGEDWSENRSDMKESRQGEKE